MKRVERGVLLFLVLILALSSGISYLALNQASKSKANIDDQKMTVALVNEDQGARFNDKNYEFGAEFIKNIEKDAATIQNQIWGEELAAFERQRLRNSS